LVSLLKKAARQLLVAEKNHLQKRQVNVVTANNDLVTTGINSIVYSFYKIIIV